MPKSGDDASLLTPAEAAQLASLGPAAIAFVAAVRKLFPGAELVAVRQIHDPLDGFVDTAIGLDQPLDDPIPMLGI